MVAVDLEFYRKGPSLVSFCSPLGMRVSHLIHSANNREVGTGVILGGHEHGVSLGDSDVDEIGLGGLGVGAVNLDDGHSMAFEPDVVGGEGTNVNQTEEVRLAGLDVKMDAMGVVHDGGIGDGLGTSGIPDAHELGHQDVHHAVIPVGKGQHDFLVIHFAEWRVWIMDDESTAQSIWVLALQVRVIPVRSSLINLKV